MRWHPARSRHTHGGPKLSSEYLRPLVDVTHAGVAGDRRETPVRRTMIECEQEEEQVARELVHELWQKASADLLRFKDHEARKLLNRLL